MVHKIADDTISNVIVFSLANNNWAFPSEFCFAQKKRKKKQRSIFGEKKQINLTTCDFVIEELSEKH